MNHVMIDGTKLVGWLRGQQSRIPLNREVKSEYEKITIHVVEMMALEKEKFNKNI